MLRRAVPLIASIAAVTVGCNAQTTAEAVASASSRGLLQIKRVYVEKLTGGPEADSLRELLISSLDSTKLFILTENAEKADAILRGAADDHAFIDTFDSSEGLGTHENAGRYSGSGGSSSTTRNVTGGYGGLSINTNESHHIKERKHEAYASVRLCNKDGDVLWSTTQESDGAKFRGASADVAAKVARQLQFDVERVRRGSITATPELRPAAPTAQPSPR